MSFLFFRWEANLGSGGHRGQRQNTSGEFMFTKSIGPIVCTSVYTEICTYLNGKQDTLKYDGNSRLKSTSCSFNMADFKTGDVFLFVFAHLEHAFC